MQLVKEIITRCQELIEEFPDPQEFAVEFFVLWFEAQKMCWAGDITDDDLYRVHMVAKPMLNQMDSLGPACDSACERVGIPVREVYDHTTAALDAKQGEL